MYDIIGDIHGCREELYELIAKLGYTRTERGPVHPDGRLLVSIGDLTDRGPDSTGTAEDVARWVKNGHALYCPGNHCNKLYRWLKGNNVTVNHGLETTVREYQRMTKTEKDEWKHLFMELYENAPLYLQLDDGNLVCAHAGIRHRDIGRHDRDIRHFVLYGDTDGFDESGLPIRKDWPFIYPQGSSWIVYGHTPTTAARVVGRTINIDTGCVFGGKLTALRYPELQTVASLSRQKLNPEKFRYEGGNEGLE
ncbi:metallophosphoesterase [Alkalicoccus urumqiensis]|uniref:Calcineurin-like phosphoesterase domain-containing protein n=1 Tax=Alkalicoccus urumqiensis TaxID=1548213 RepID=A0A2P6MEV5_ALKUR|nr:metallophosphoesterase [Alkalicoccus urumqiensis]PRO64839.1 hypothetical protein C6I21_13090 [Alkalicoccus urumqiensis]